MNGGAKVAHYTIVERIGAGGMGEVYRATDTKLGRDVALKVLPAEFTADSMRMQRFQREAQLLAALNHPNIAAIYGLEDAGSTRALVMELVDGLTLVDRIAQNALPVEEALVIARQIAEALEYAHERGIIHRDLKPANVKLTPDGAVKVLDFGLAKAMADDPAASGDLSKSPTLSLAATKAGIILGTAAYMSPEQAKGKPVDRRADIWSFGVVLHEMLTGAQLYTGETVSEVMAHVITQTPSLDSLPAASPPRIRHLLQRCLTKDPRARLRDIGEARIAIEQAIANPTESFAVVSGAGQISALPAPALPLWRRALPWAAVAILAATTVLAMWRPWQAPPTPSAPVRLSVEIGADGTLFTGFGAGAVLSPDGRRMVFVATPFGKTRQLFVRAMDQLQAVALSGTEGARNPFFNPQGDWIGFFADGKLKKVAVTGGAIVTLCDAPEDRGGSWSEDGTIIFAPDANQALSRVADAGGAPEFLTELDQSIKQRTHRWPQVLPGSKAVLFTANETRANFDDANIVVWEMERKQQKTVLRGGSYARYVASGHLTYVHQGVLFAVPFDPERLEATGQPAPLVEGVISNVGTGGAQYALSNDGTLIYAKGAGYGSGWYLLWLDEKGKTSPLRGLGGLYFNPAFSPDGTRLALQVFDKQMDIHVYDWKRDTPTRITFAPQEDSRPSWTPDGRWITFASEQEGPGNLYMVRSDGTGQPIRLTQSSNTQLSSAWHPSGKFLAFTERNTQGNQGSVDIGILPVEWDPKTGPKPGQPSALLSGPFGETDPAFSPDGRWLAYVSDESGIREVFVRPVPAGEGKWQVSSGGGVFPMWSRNGRDLFYRTEDSNRIMVSTYSVTGSSFQADRPRVWADAAITAFGPNRNLDLHRDGKRFVVLRSEATQSGEKSHKVVMIQNFFEELRRIAPPSKR